MYCCESDMCVYMVVAGSMNHGSNQYPHIHMVVASNMHHGSNNVVLLISRCNARCVPSHDARFQKHGVSAIRDGKNPRSKLWYSQVPPSILITRFPLNQSSFRANSS